MLVLLEQGLISKADMETKVCPVLLELTEPSSDDDYKSEAVAVRALPLFYCVISTGFVHDIFYYFSMLSLNEP